MTETRAEKAQRLVDEGLVHIFHTGLYDTGALVGEKESAYTTIVYTSGVFFCHCEWGKYHSYTDDLCAHALAVKLAVEKVVK